MPYNRIVVGTDGSDSARRAVEHSAWLAGRIGAPLLVSHAYREAAEGGGEGRHVGASVLRDACLDLGLPVPPQPVLREGDAADALLSIAGEEPSSLIVVGNRGLGRRRVVLGNVPGRVAHTAPGDVLIAHTTAARPRLEYRRMLLATDRSPTADRAVAAGRALAEATGAEAEELHVREGDPVVGIVGAAAERDVDVVVVGNRGMTGLRRFLASVPSKVMRSSPVHVLLVKTT